MNRRNFLRGVSAASIGAGSLLIHGPLGFGMRSASAATTTPGKVLVMVFQRGGCDGLNVTVPFGDPDYAALRPTIGIPAPGTAAHAALDLDGFFGLHPSLGALLPAWDQGGLAVLPAVQYPDASRSHFTGQRQIESGAPREDLDGWLNRYLGLQSHAVFGGLGVGGLPHALSGPKRVSVLGQDVSFQLEVPAREDAPLRARLASVYAEDALADTRPARKLVQDFGRKFLSDIELLNSADLDAIPVEAQYPNTGFGRSLMRLAQFIKLGRREPLYATEVASVSIGGWDTHAMQGGAQPDGQQARQLRDFGDSLAAFYADLGALGADVLTLTQTEFGRTMRENASRGTDHGHAAAWFALGGGVRGGIYGDWPGLSPAALIDGNYLQHSVDFRDVYADVLANHLGIGDFGVTEVIGTQPDGHVAAPIGLFSAGAT